MASGLLQPLLRHSGITFHADARIECLGDVPGADPCEPVFLVSRAMRVDLFKETESVGWGEPFPRPLQDAGRSQNGEFEMECVPLLHALDVIGVAWESIRIWLREIQSLLAVRESFPGKKGSA